MLQFLKARIALARPLCGNPSSGTCVSASESLATRYRQRMRPTSMQVRGGRNTVLHWVERTQELSGHCLIFMLVITQCFTLNGHHTVLNERHEWSSSLSHCIPAELPSGSHAVAIRLSTIRWLILCTDVQEMLASLGDFMDIELESNSVQASTSTTTDTFIAVSLCSLPVKHD